MHVIGYPEVASALEGRELEVIDVVRRAYELHDEGRSSVPHSTFLRFPGDTRNRIIGLPAFLGGDRPAAGMKWIASFPDNIATGLPRANAVLVLNSLSTGRPEALLEASLISARRTAASAALAARTLYANGEPDGVTLIGTGVINLEVLRFLCAVWPDLPSVTLFDTDPARSASFAKRCAEVVPNAKIAVADTVDAAVGAHHLICIATSAATPHMNLAAALPGSVVLHLSLRDLDTETILANQNVVDDPDHAVRERTSLHLAEQVVGNRDFIDTTIGALCRGTSTFRPDPGRTVIFSPFGLGVLDVAVAQLVAESSVGVQIDNFLPA
ncbi:MAG TPA: 2,3-diaminopropionate biosynthesis protein SbnB [Pseudonocardiaceae bacterium]|jgi:ornithine cyclodeaminase